jgi:hypothetical protein
LPRPSDVVEELPKIESVVIWRVSLCVIGWCDGAHLVTVDRVIEKETLDLLPYFTSSEMVP